MAAGGALLLSTKESAPSPRYAPGTWATGKKLWSARMPSAREACVTHTNLTLAKGVVAVGWGRGSVAYDMKSGRRLWNSTTGAKCVDKGFAGGGALLALESCGEGADTTYRVQRLDPRTGRARWTYKVAAGVQDVYLPSADPPVLAVAAGDEGGTQLATISMGGDAYDPGGGDRYFSAGFFGALENCAGVVVGRDRVFVTSKEQSGIDQPENWIVAFDRTTGKTEGKLDGRSLEPVVPLRMSGDRLLVLRSSLSDIEPSAVLSWDPRTGRGRTSWWNGAGSSSPGANSPPPTSTPRTPCSPCPAPAAPGTADRTTGPRAEPGRGGTRACRPPSTTFPVYWAARPPLRSFGSRSNSPSRAPSTNAVHSASVYRSTVSGSRDDRMATAPSGR